jgi:hypothetical protein
MGVYDMKSVEEFRQAFTKGVLQSVLARIQLERAQLLSFYDIKELVKPGDQTYRGIHPIPVDQIIGSEGRYNDFSNTFLPKKAMLKNRWSRVSKAHDLLIDLPPISVYKLGNAYFVRDGNHRVSVAKATGIAYIDAEILELDSHIELKPGMTNRQILRQVIQYERQQVVDATGIDTLIDFAQIRFTEPGRYHELLHHIDIHRKFIRITQKKELSFNEAVISWHKNVYLPIAEAVTEQKIPGRFPGRTTADLYIWIVKHLNRLKGRYGFDVQPDEASRDYADKFGQSLFQRVVLWFRKRAER